MFEYLNYVFEFNFSANTKESDIKKTLKVKYGYYFKLITSLIEYSIKEKEIRYTIANLKH